MRKKLIEFQIMKVVFTTMMVVLFKAECFGREVSFSWEKMEGATGYEIQLSKTQDFSKPLQSQKLQTPEFSSQLGPGKYFYRVRVIDNTNHPGKWSAAAPVNIGAPGPDLISPPSGWETSYYDQAPQVEFSWKSVDLTSQYEIVVTDQSGTEVFRNTIDKASFKTTLSKGEYHWQVRTLGRPAIPGRVSDEEIPSEYAKPFNFKITKK